MNDGARLDIFRGRVNVSVSESLMAVPEGGCTGRARLRFTASGHGTNAGIGAAFLAVVVFVAVKAVARMEDFPDSPQRKTAPSP